MGNSVPGMCPAGYYCPSGTIAPIPCPVGTYQPNPSSTSCLTCPAGYYCDVLGIDDTVILTKTCAAGYVCLSGAIIPNPTDGTTGYMCTPGNYCPAGTTT
jgi:hypothetical protein